MTDTKYNTPISRATVEQQIEDLISLLDFLDGDPDCEPSLGWQVDLGHFPQDPGNGYDAGDDREGTGSGSPTEDHEPEDFV